MYPLAVALFVVCSCTPGRLMALLIQSRAPLEPPFQKKFEALFEMPFYFLTSLTIMQNNIIFEKGNFYNFRIFFKIETKFWNSEHFPEFVFSQILNFFEILNL